MSVWGPQIHHAYQWITVQTGHVTWTRSDGERTPQLKLLKLHIRTTTSTVGRTLLQVSSLILSRHNGGKITAQKFKGNFINENWSVSVFFPFKYVPCWFPTWKWTWKGRLENGDHFVSASICWVDFKIIRLIASHHWFGYWLDTEEASSLYLNQWWPSSDTHTCDTREWVKKVTCYMFWCDILDFVNEQFDHFLGKAMIRLIMNSL